MSENPQWIMIVDDSSDNRAEFRRMLLQGSDRRYEFIETDTASNALRILQNQQGDSLDCVLLKHHLPDMDALEILARLCDGQSTPPLPVVVITDEDRSAGRELLRAGAQDYLARGWLTATSLTRSVDKAIDRFAIMLTQAAAPSDLLERKDAFLAMLSHEIRSPLASIANAVQLLGLQKGNESPIQNQARGIIERQIGQLQHLVDDLLEVSRIKTNRPPRCREEVVIHDVVERAAEPARTLIDQHHHALEQHQTIRANASATAFDTVT
jgi:signal transduction histidine kinase